MAEQAATGRPFNRGAPRAPGIRQALAVAQSGRCGLTGMPYGDRPELDHIVPVSAGGRSTQDNLHWTHPAANRAKGNMTVAEFREWLLAAADALRQKIALEALL